MKYPFFPIATLLFLSFCTAPDRSTDEHETATPPVEKAEAAPVEVEESINKKATTNKISPELIAGESKPYTIASYFKFYLNDREDAERVLSSKWNPDNSPGGTGIYDDQLETLDLRGGYMKVVTPVTDGFRHTEYVYWNLSNERKLFAMNQVGMEPFSGEVTTDKFEFRVFEKDEWKPADTGQLQKLTDELKSKRAIDLQQSELLTSLFNMPAELTPETRFGYQIKLPQKGKDLQFVLNHSEGAEVISTQEITLTFDDGAFEYQP